MDWPVAAERNLEALKRIVASLHVMAKWARPSDTGVPTLPRFLHRRIVRLLAPAEAVARRLIIVAARGLVVTLPPPSKPGPKTRSSFAKNGAGTGIILPRGVTMPPPTPRFAWSPSPVNGGRSEVAAGRDAGSSPAERGRGTAVGGGGGGNQTRTRKLSLPLFDPLRRPFRERRRCVPAHAGPRISTPGIGQRFVLPPPPSPDDPVSALRLTLRLQALSAALDDLPRHALRFARWQARVAAAGQHRPEARPRRTRALRRGHPPGCRLKRWDPTARRRKHIRDIDEVLALAHDMALYALETTDTS